MAVRESRDFMNVPMARDEVNVYPTSVIANRLRRISWGAILAGIAIAMVTMLALNMLGLTIGAATVNPASEIDPVEPALGTGAVIWFAASNLIALFLGGYVAGRMSGIRDDDWDGAIHGLVTWAVVALITLWMLTTSVGSIISAMTNAASQAISSAGQVVADVSPEVAEALELQDMTWQGVENELSMLFAPASTLDQTDPDAVNGSESTQNSNMTLAQIQLNRAVRDMLNMETIDDTSRNEVVTMLAAQANITEDEARQRLDQWEQTYVQVRTDAEETAREVSQSLADAVTLFSGAVFAAMVIGAFAAAMGGAVGAPGGAVGGDDPNRRVSEVTSTTAS